MRCVWQSIKPGRTVASRRSIILADSGTCFRSAVAAPTALIRPPSTTIAASVRYEPERMSKTRAASRNSGGSGAEVDSANAEAEYRRTRLQSCHRRPKKDQERMLRTPSFKGLMSAILNLAGYRDKEIKRRAGLFAITDLFVQKCR